MENTSTLFLCSLMHSCATRYPKTRRARSRCRNREHATMIVKREARADCFWVLQASAGVVHGLHGVLLLPCAPVAHVLGPAVVLRACGPRAWARCCLARLWPTCLGPCCRPLIVLCWEASHVGCRLCQASAMPKWRVWSKGDARPGRSADYRADAPGLYIAPRCNTSLGGLANQFWCVYGAFLGHQV